MLETLKALGPSIIRTVTSYLIGWLVTLVAFVFKADWQPSEAVYALVATVVGTLWYAAFRWLEEKKSSSWGWLLGMPGAPKYVEDVSGEITEDATEKAYEPGVEPAPDEGLPLDWPYEK